MLRFWCLVAVCALSAPALSLPWDIEDSEIESRAGRSTTCACGWVNRGRIVGGKEAGRNEFPWIVSIEDREGHFCGGSIITEFHVLTAAHCTLGYRASELTANIGAHNRDVGADRYRITRIIDHEGYVPRAERNDISLLVTAQQIRFSQNVGPVCLPPRRLSLTGETVTVKGWGLTTNKGIASKALLNVDLKVISASDCYRSYRNSFNSATNLCTFTPRKDSCQGDSGGPLVWLDPAINRYVQVALVSFGRACGGESPAVNTDVGAYVDWINRRISQSNQLSQTCTSQ